MIIIQFMEKDLSYVTSEGYTVFTSQFLKNRGTCCKSACLHCPYGYTLKKLGLKFLDVTTSDKEFLHSIMEESGTAAVDLEPFFPDNIKLIQIKDTVCGMILKNHIVIKHLYLKPHFKDQGLSKELVESYYFI